MKSVLFVLLFSSHINVLALEPSGQKDSRSHILKRLISASDIATKGAPLYVTDIQVCSREISKILREVSLVLASSIVGRDTEDSSGYLVHKKRADQREHIFLVDQVSVEDCFLSGFGKSEKIQLKITSGRAFTGSVSRERRTLESSNVMLQWCCIVARDYGLAQLGNISQKNKITFKKFYLELSEAEKIIEFKNIGASLGVTLTDSLPTKVFEIKLDIESVGGGI